LVEELKWKQFPVLNDGHVCLVDVMGDDYSIVEAARTSYGDGTRHTSKDRTLIRYLMRHRHTTPFEMAEIKLRVRVPMDCWRQWIRHRTANVNEYSTRYSIAIDAVQETAPDQWRSQAESNRQGSGDYLSQEIGILLTDAEKDLQQQARTVYQERLDHGVAREQARKDLPLCTYTEAFWKIDLHNLFHFLSLRMDSHAQWEIQEFARAIGHNIVKPLFPLAWEAFEDYRLGAVHLSRLEIEVMQALMMTGKNPITEEDFVLHQHESWRELKRCRERDECFEKLARLKVINIDATAA
jgi:thymidylate synthase (FAD)